MVKTYKLLSIDKSLQVSLCDLHENNVIEADITIPFNESPGVCSVMRKKDEPDRGYAVLGVLKGVQKEMFIQGDDMYYMRGGASLVNEAKAIRTINDIVTKEEFEDLDKIPSLNIYILTEE